MEAKSVDKFGALASVLAKNLNDIPDLPDYVAPPAGVYKLAIEDAGQKIINEKQAFVVNYVVMENVSLSNPQEDATELAAIKPGSKMSEAFYFNDAERIETVLGVLKKKYGPLGANLGTTNLMEILDKMAGMTIQAQIGRRQDEKDKTKFHPYTKNIIAAV